MFEMLQGHLMPLFSAETARRTGRAGLRQPCLVILTGLAVQLALGMVLNLYIALPAAEARASYLREIETAPVVLTAHALVAVLLLATAGVMLLRAIALRDMAVIALVGTGLAALLGAFGAGELFVRDERSGVSLTMAMLTGTALLCYACLQAVTIRQRPLAREWDRGSRVADVPLAREGDRGPRVAGVLPAQEGDRGSRVTGVPLAREGDRGSRVTGGRRTPPPQ